MPWPWCASCARNGNDRPPGVYLDSCVLLSLFLADSGYGAAEQWLRRQGDAAILVSHWLLVEVAGVVSLCVRRGELSAERAAAIHAEFECFRRERLQLLEPRAWFQGIAQREQLTLATADRGLIQAAHQLGVAHQWISGQST